MSRLNDKLNIASRTGFHALEVEDIESDSGDDVIETSPTANTSPLSPSNDELKAPYASCIRSSFLADYFPTCAQSTSSETFKELIEKSC
jgi:hypothetical protein